MLTELSVRNFSLIRSCEICFSPRLNVITGESGAGKSLVVDAIQFALGKRPNHTFIGGNGSECFVGLRFQLPEKLAKRQGLQTDMKVERTFGRDGKSCVSLNSETIKVSELRELVTPLVDISSQFAQQDIFRTSFHREMLDEFGDEGFRLMAAAYRRDFQNLQGMRNELAMLVEAAQRGLEERSYLEYLVGELAAANVAPGEKAAIHESLFLLEHAEEVLRRTNAASQMLYAGGNGEPSAFDLTARASDELSPLKTTEIGTAKLNKALELIEQSQDALSEANHILLDLGEIPDYSQGELKQLRNRLDEIYTLERKYRVGAEEMPSLLEKSRMRLDALVTSPEEIGRLKSEVERLSEMLLEQAKKLNVKRVEIGVQLTKTVGKYLTQLGFKQADFIADISEPEEITPEVLREYGIGRTEFLISLNPGEPARPLPEVASGGEASRLLLAVKAALQRKLSYATIVFDEIEAGVGGDAAFNVADVLLDLAAGQQVIAVTHLAPVAASGSHHLEAVKTVSAGSTSINVIPLSQGQRAKSIARMLGDAKRPESLALAESFLERMAARRE